MTSSGERAQRPGAGFWLYNLANVLGLGVFLKSAFVIRSDGGAGFGEFALKSGLALAAVTLFIASVGASWRAFVKRAGVASGSVCALLACLLLALAALGVWEACSDGAGHCRQWRLFLS